MFSPLLINCDLAEHSNTKLCEKQNSQLMPSIHLANIACGGHAGNKPVMIISVQQCIDYDVKIGAHPSYIDPINFGRVSLSLSLAKLKQSLIQQITELANICEQKNTKIHHLKAHGALYHDSDSSSEIKQLLLELSQNFALQLMTSATENTHKTQAINIPYQEVFADRAYNNNAQIVSRQHPNSLFQESELILKQYRQLNNERTVSVYPESTCPDSVFPNHPATINVPANANTVCFHSDNPASCQVLKSLKIKKTTHTNS